MINFNSFYLEYNKITMNNKYKIIDVYNWIRRTTFKYFSTFDNPTYSFNVKIDITNVLSFSKETKTSFFINFLFLISKVNNELKSLRLRYVDGEVRLYEKINPTFTVKTEDGSFNNCFVEYTSVYEEFYKRCVKEIEDNNKETKNPEEYNSTSYDRFYSSCLTTIDIISMTQPLNTRDKNSINVPRIFWDKYIKIGDTYYLTLNITVSHILVDGEQLSEAFNKVREYASNFKSIIK